MPRNAYPGSRTSWRIAWPICTTAEPVGLPKLVIQFCVVEDTNGGLRFGFVEWPSGAPEIGTSSINRSTK